MAQKDAAKPATRMDNLCEHLLYSKILNNAEENSFDASVLKKTIRKLINAKLSAFDLDVICKTYELNTLAVDNHGDIWSFMRQGFGCFKEEPPSIDFRTQVHVMKTVDCKLCCTSNEFVVFISIPEKLFQPHHLFNFRVFQRLNFVLILVAEVFKNDRQFSSIDQWKLNGFSSNHMSSFMTDHCFLKATYLDSSNLQISLKITCVPENIEIFDLDELAVDQNGLQFCFASGSESSENIEAIPSPRYNQQVIGCLLRKFLHKKLSSKLETFSRTLKRAVMLCAFWAKERSLCHILTLEAIVEIFLNFVADGSLINTDEHGLFSVVRSFWTGIKKIVRDCASGDDSQPLQTWSSFYRGLNVFRNVSRSQLDLMSRELNVNSQILDAFQGPKLYRELFSKRSNIFSSVDLIVSLEISIVAVLKQMSPGDRIKWSFDAESYAVEKLVPLLTTALAERCQYVKPVNVSLHKRQDEIVDELSPSYAKKRKMQEADSRVLVCLGIKLNYSYQYEAVVKGPLPENTVGGKEFCELWGPEMGKLRRFKDGTICYAVTWPELAKSKRSLRLVAPTIAQHIITQHVGTESVIKLSVTGNEFDSKMSQVLKLEGTGEEELQKSRNVVSRFEAAVYQLSKRLPLGVKSVTCVNESVNRCSSVVAPKCVHSDVTEEQLLQDCKLSPESVRIPRSVQDLINCSLCRRRSVKLQIILETHDRWPSNSYEAVQRLKTAFYLKMEELFKLELNGSPCVATRNGLFVFFEEELFELFIFHPPELRMAMRQAKAVNGAALQVQTVASRHLNREQVLKPRLLKYLDGFQQFFPQFGNVCRTVKLWINSHLLLFELGDLPVDLIVAAMLETSLKTGSCPQSVQAGLFEFWSFVSSFDFQTNFICLELQDPVLPSSTKKLLDEKSIGLKFEFSREKFPALAVFTPVDVESSLFTSDVSSMLLTRLAKLSSKAHQVASEAFISKVLFTDDLQSTLNQVFSTKMDVFDCVIHLKDLEPGIFSGNGKREKLGLPVADVDVKISIAERLKRVLGHVFLIFFDVLNPAANVIGLKIKKEAGKDVTWATENIKEIAEEIEVMIGGSLLQRILIADKIQKLK